MFTKNYYAGNFYSRQRARLKGRGLKLAGRGGRPQRSKLPGSRPQSISMSRGRSRSSSIGSTSSASTILYPQPKRITYNTNYLRGFPYVERPDGSYYPTNAGPGRPPRTTKERATQLIEKAVEDLVGSGADWLSARRGSAKKKQKLRRKKITTRK